MRKEIGILFSTLMVQALLAGRKTQTRRILKVKGCKPFMPHEGFTLEEIQRWNKDYHPYGKPGDILYVREEHYAYGEWWPSGTTETHKQKWRFEDRTREVRFIYGGYHYAEKPPSNVLSGFSKTTGWYKRNSLFMPKAAARIWLQVESVRVERLQDISEEDAIAEGILLDKDFGYECYLCNEKHHLLSEDNICEDGFYKDANKSFQSLWYLINGAESWDANPWLWVVTFKVLSTTGRPASLDSESTHIDAPMLGVPEVLQ